MRAARAALISLVALSSWSADAAGLPDGFCDLYFTDGVSLRGVPVAKTVSAQAQGLSHTDQIGAGLLFSWSAADARIFWMRDTRIALTVGFFDADGVLFAIEDMQPMTDTYHFSGAPAVDALELAQGQFSRIGLKIGSRLIRRECRQVQP